MEIIHAIILGIIEGITEFLPISSTGHLIISQKILGISTINDFFTLIIQLGAISASIFFYRERIGKIIKDSVKIRTLDIKRYSINQKLGIWIILAIIPTLAIGYLLRKQIEVLQNSVIIIAITTFIFGIVFYAIENYKKKLKHQELSLHDIKFKHLLVMGIFQAVSLVPGVSRSGSTVSGGLLQGIRIKDSIELSFLMGIPVIFVASFYKLLSSISSVSSSMILATVIGFVTSFIVALFAIRLTLGVLSNHGFYPFMIYRIGLSILLVFLVFIGYIS